MSRKIHITVKTIPHPDQKRLTDLWARMVVSELIKREEANKAVSN